MMVVLQPQPAQPPDLVGGPFAVIESDPGVFTSLTRRLGVRGLELVELYDIEPWAVDHLSPHGLILCFLWRKDAHRPADFDDPAAERVWFANQLSDDACATHAILNVLLNCPHVDVGEDLRAFRRETEGMSPVMRGLAITNSPVIRPAHNYLARPADVRASLNNLAITTFDAEKKKAKAQVAASNLKQHPAKRTKTSGNSKTTGRGRGRPKGKAKPKGKRKAKDDDTDMDEDYIEEEDESEEEEEEEEQEETYHFIGYVPAHGKVWELDGLKSGPLEVGELPMPPPSNAPSSSNANNSNSNPTPGQGVNKAWMDVARPALRMKMARYGGGAAEAHANIRFSLLAIVDDTFCQASDKWEMARREGGVVERRLGELEKEGMEGRWEDNVDPSLKEVARHAFAPLPFGVQTKEEQNGEHDPNTVQTPNPPSAPGRTYTSSFASTKLERDAKILQLSSRADLIKAWEECVRDASRAKILVEDEVAKGIGAQTDHIKRTHDYEPFSRAFLTKLHAEGLLNPLLDRDEDGKKRRGRPPGGGAKGKNGTSKPGKR
ncbi:unnamed protein product [Cyclocybe aegerita]|uniref:ubiquitinyl hydrolase 1 n=1 Tax=Cyclocybe aegerita TaxID=1973307 RepID=A0A8S0WB59_CYCAE|nr:unnamed protein product [Cyclocybe aegerita]